MRDRLLSRENLLPVLVFLVALVVRGSHWWGQWQSNPLFLAPNMDEFKHHQWAQQIAGGAGLGPSPFFRAPLYYGALAALYEVAGPAIPLARALGCVLGAATCALIALLGRALAGARAGLIAGLLAAAYWPFVHADQLLLSTGLETFLGALLLLLLLTAARRGAWWLHLAAGGVLGLAAITRPTVLSFVPAAALWTLYGERLVGADRPGGSPWPVRVRNLSLVGLAAVAAIAPVTVRNRVVGGEWVLVATNGGLNFFIGNNPRADGVSAVVPGTRADWDGGYEDTHAIARRGLVEQLGRPPTEGEVSGFWYSQAWAWLRSDPAGALRLALRKLALFWAPVEIPNNNAVWFFARQSPLAPLYLIGFPVIAVLGIAGFTLLSRSAWRVWSLPAAFGLIGMFTVVGFFVVDRYRLPLVPVLMLAGGSGLARLPELWSQRRIPRLGGYLLAGVAVVGLELLCRPGSAFWPQGVFFKAQETAQGERVLGDHYLRQSSQRPESLAAALRHYQAAATALPFSPGVQYALGTALLRSGRPDLIAQAGKPLEAAIRMQPTFADARRFRAEWLLRQGREPEAIEEYRAVVRLQPWGDSYAAALVGLGVLLEQEGSLEEAKTWLVRAVQNAPGDPGTAEYLVEAAQRLREREKVREAIELLELGAAAAPGQRLILDELKDARRQAGAAGQAAAADARPASRSGP